MLFAVTKPMRQGFIVKGVHPAVVNLVVIFSAKDIFAVNIDVQGKGIHFITDTGIDQGIRVMAKLVGLVKIHPVLPYQIPPDIKSAGMTVLKTKIIGIFRGIGRPVVLIVSIGVAELVIGYLVVAKGTIYREPFGQGQQCLNFSAKPRRFGSIGI